jgi:putative inorganic carbon (HCO3(-)) transporter
METADNLINRETDRSTGTMGSESVPTERRASQWKSLVAAYVGLLMFMLIYFSRPEDWIPGLSNVPLAKIAVILALIALALSLQHIRQHLPRVILYLTLLIGQLFLASVQSPVWRGGAFQATLDFAKVLIVIVVMAVAVNTPRRLRLLIFTQAASVVAIAAVTLWKGHLVLGRLDGMLGGSYSDPNDLALAFVMSLPLCLALLFLTSSWFWKVFWMSSILLMIYAVFLTGSRGGFISLTVTGAVCLWDFAIRGRRGYLLVLTAVLGAIVLVSSGGILFGRLKGTFNPKENAAASYSSAQERQHLFWRSIEVTKEHPLFGVGPGNFEQVSGKWLLAHNSFTQMSSEGGIPALIFYVLILWIGFANVRAAKRFAKGQRKAILMAKGLHASLAGYVVGSCFLSVPYAFFPYILVAYTTALFEIAKKSASRSKAHERGSQAVLVKNRAAEVTEAEMCGNAT